METAAKTKKQNSEKEAPIGDAPPNKKKTKNQEKSREKVIEDPSLKGKQQKKGIECKEQDMSDVGHRTKRGTWGIQKQNQVTEVDHSTKSSGIETGKNVPQIKTPNSEKEVKPISKRKVKVKGVLKSDTKKPPAERVCHKKNHFEVLEQNSDTESMKCKTKQSRAAHFSENQSINFDLCGDILGILAKQKQQREKKRSQRKGSSDNSQSSICDLAHDIEGRFATDIKKDGVLTKIKDLPSLSSRDHDKTFIQRPTRGKKNHFNGERSLSGSFQIPLSQQDEEQADNKALKGKRNTAIGPASDSNYSDDKSKQNTIINKLGKAKSHSEVSKPKNSNRDRSRRTVEKENKRGSGEWTQDEVQRLER